MALQLLILDDDETHVEAILRAFKKVTPNANIRVVSTLKKYREKIADFPPDIALVDLFLPDGNSEELLTHPPEEAQFPVLVMTAFGNQSTGSQLVKLGALDYVVKSSESFAMLPRTVESALREWHLLVNRKFANEELKKSAERLSLATQAGNVGIWDFDIIENQLCWDEQMFRLYGISPAPLQITYEFWVKSLHPEDVKRADAEIQLAIAGKKEFDTEFRIVWPDGSIHTIRALAAVKYDYADHPRRMVGTNWDITAQKESEAALLEMNRQLEASTLLANDLSVQAQNANVAKSEFLANMSHEIRTPMNGVIGMTSLLLDTPLTPVQQYYAETISKSGEALLILLNDILDFSKIEAQKLDIEIMDFDLESLLTDFTTILTRRAEENNILFSSQSDAAVPSLLRGDPGRLRQILSNLTSNAFKFTPRGKIGIQVDLLQETSTDVVLRFAVHDTGIGISQETINDLFEKFTQADTSITRKYGGLGLGLAISKQLVSLMDGEIGVKSEIGKGSEFWFTLPLKKQEKILLFTKNPSLEGVKVLIVDSDTVSQSILKQRMLSWGMLPTEALDAENAMQILEEAEKEKAPFLIAIITTNLVGGHGEVLARNIKTSDALASTKLLLLTAKAERGDARYFQKMGFDAYAPMPIPHDDLLGILSLLVKPRPDSSHPIITRHTARETLKRFDGRNVRILLAEDNIINKMVAIGILKNLGLTAYVVENGEEALQAIKKGHYDLIFMDVQMPVMDGLEATKQIRKYEAFLHSEVFAHNARTPLQPKKLPVSVPIIAMTANAMQGDREQCIAAGMNDYVSKPISPQALAKVLDDWLPSPSVEFSNEMLGANSDTDVEDSLPTRFDRAGLLERLGGDQEVFKMIISAFIEDIPRQIDMLRTCLHTRDATGFRLQAHTMKGASANMGGNRLRAIATDLEDAAKANDFEKVMTLFPVMEQEFSLLRSVMEKI